MPQITCSLSYIHPSEIAYVFFFAVENHISSDGTAHAPFYLGWGVGSVSQTSAVIEATKVLQAE